MLVCRVLHGPAEVPSEEDSTGGEGAVVPWLKLELALMSLLEASSFRVVSRCDPIHSRTIIRALLPGHRSYAVRD